MVKPIELEKPHEYLVWVMKQALGLDLKNNPDNAAILLPEVFKKPTLIWRLRLTKLSYIFTSE